MNENKILKMLEFLSKQSGIFSYRSSIRKKDDGTFYWTDQSIVREEESRDYYSLTIDFKNKKIKQHSSLISGHNGDYFDDRVIDVSWDKLDNLYNTLNAEMKSIASIQLDRNEKNEKERKIQDIVDKILAQF